MQPVVIPPKPVIAIKAEKMELAIPYLTHYFSYSSTLPPSHLKELDKTKWYGLFRVLMHSILSDPTVSLHVQKFIVLIANYPIITMVRRMSSTVPLVQIEQRI